MSLRPAVPVAGTPVTRPRRAPLAAVALVLMLAVGGCTIPGFSAETSSGANSKDAAAGPGSSWFWYQEGDAPPASAPVVWPASSTTTAPAVTAAPSASSDVDCSKRLSLVTKTLPATGGAGQGTLTWTHVDDERIIEYRVAAVLQERPGGDDLPAQTWTTVARPASGCQKMTATVPGLISGRHYVFWLDAVVTAQADTRKEPMIGRSNAFLVT